MIQTTSPSKQLDAEGQFLYHEYNVSPFACGRLDSVTSMKLLLSPRNASLLAKKTLIPHLHMKEFDFHQLDATKNWYDVTISHEALKKGFQNYLFTVLPVWHRPHGSRPWKQLKYKNPLKYYWLKFTKGLDKI